MILVGYCDDTKGYRLLDKETYKLTKRRDVTFFERRENLDLTDINNDVSASSTNSQIKQVESQLRGTQSTSTTHTGNILAPTVQTEEPLSETVEKGALITKCQTVATSNGRGVQLADEKQHLEFKESTFG
ncbi:hypothetical protein EVAR_41071_1 [Eumeta japonica]|uniref:Retroviral polymerase SH3-like domain-containing protein n=1 Tax=Eumeta variegata TaxID=151549 RepID=A0A4C1XQR6_EUMVA|nr:hypothetical protein EVAR_41071_1 [Eumeta japonica]